MPKLKNTYVEFVTEDEENQIEHSADLAGSFIVNELLPQLDDFEFDNDDSNYVSGMATHALFIELIRRMADMGYNEKDLRKEIKTYINWSGDQTLH